MDNRLHKKFGWALSGAFKTLFNEFGKNILAALLIVLIYMLFMVPFIVSFVVMNTGAGFLLMNSTTSDIISTVLGTILVFAGGGILIPSLSTGYFAPKTVDVLEDVLREKGERKRIMFKSLGRILPAAFFQALLIYIPSIAFQFVPFWIFNEVPLSNIFYQSGRIGLLIVGYLAFLVIMVVLEVFVLFTRQAALFEEEAAGFRAVIRSMKLMAKKNFWPSLGEFALAYLAIMTAVYILVLPATFLLVLAVMAVSASGFPVILAILAGIILMAFFLFATAVSMVLMESLTCHLYLNARARSEGIPIPEPKAQE